MLIFGSPPFPGPLLFFDCFDQCDDVKSTVFFFWSDDLMEPSFDFLSALSYSESDDSVMTEDLKLDAPSFDRADFFGSKWWSDCCFLSSSFLEGSLDSGKSEDFLVDLKDLDLKNRVFFIGDSLNLEISIFKGYCCWGTKFSSVVYLVGL